MKEVLLADEADDALRQVADEFPPEIFAPARAGRPVILSAILHYHANITVVVPWRRDWPVGTQDYKIVDSLFDLCVSRLNSANAGSPEPLEFNDFINSIVKNSLTLLHLKKFRDTIRGFILSEVTDGRKKLDHLILDLPGDALTEGQLNLKLGKLDDELSKLLNKAEQLELSYLQTLLADPKNQIAPATASTKYKLSRAKSVKAKTMRKLEQLPLRPFHDSLIKLVKALNNRNAGPPGPV